MSPAPADLGFMNAALGSLQPNFWCMEVASRIILLDNKFPLRRPFFFCVLATALVLVLFTSVYSQALTTAKQARPQNRSPLL
jgi:hypothetical protein